MITIKVRKLRKKHTPNLSNQMKNVDFSVVFVALYTLSMGSKV